MPFFSIVIPTFNRSDLFPYAVQSVLDQTFADFEIIVSDNCSGDDTAQVARQFRDRRFKYVKTPRHFTIADNWEFARSHAVGKLIFMLSDDDALLPAALERFAYEARNNEADFLFCKPAYYRDLGYPGPDRNSVNCPSFSGTSANVQADEFIRPLFLFRQSVRYASERLHICQDYRGSGGSSNRPVFLDEWRGILGVAHSGDFRQNDSSY